MTTYKEVRDTWKHESFERFGKKWTFYTYGGYSVKICDSAEVNDMATIGYGASIGDKSTIGDEANIGCGARIGDKSTIGDKANIGCGARIGYGARIGDKSAIGDEASIGYKATIGYGARIGDKSATGDEASIGEGAYIGDKSAIGDGARIGEGACISNGTTIGHRVSIDCNDKFLCVGPIGSRDAMLTIVLHGGKLILHTGCFHGMLAEFLEKLEVAHKNNEHARAYRTVIEAAKVIFQYDWSIAGPPAKR